MSSTEPSADPFDSDSDSADALQARHDRAADLRDAAGTERDAAARLRDHVSDRRDRESSAQDATQLAMTTWSDSTDTTDASSATNLVLMTVVGTATLRTMAALDRQAAAEDRAAAETDRANARRDRIASAQRTALSDLDADAPPAREQATNGRPARQVRRRRRWTSGT
jgi:hypothetical protein